MTQYRTGYSTLTASDIVCPSTSTALGIGKAPCNSSNCSASNPKLIQEYSPTAHRIRSLPRVVYVYLDGCHGYVLAAPTRYVRALPDRAAGPRPAWRADVAQSSTASRHCHVQNFHIFFAAVPKRRRLDSTRLTHGPTLHHPPRGSFREARGSTYFQCNVSKYAHVLGLKLPKIKLVRA